MIRIYTRSWCEDSVEAKKFLEEHRLLFEEIDIEKDPKAREFVMSVNEGKQRTPTFEVDGRTFHCSPFDAERLRRELGLKD
jgi:mycoredoxin